MKTYEIKKQGRHLLVIGLPNWLGNPDSVLCTRSEAGEPIFPTVWNDDALAALYDERQTNENLNDGDQFTYRGKVVARVAGLHVVAA